MAGKRSNRFWLAILGVLLLAAVIGLVFVRSQRETGAQVQVLQGGEVADTLSLGKNVTRRYESETGGYNIVEVKDGRVSVTEASCPDKVCVNHGPTDQTADPIVCLPNKLVVRVLAPGDDPNQLDGVSS